jgi:hypothetical protein
MQKSFFAYFLISNTCLFLNQSFGVFRQKSFLPKALANYLRTGPLLDISLRPGVRPALAITRKDGR